MRVTVDSDKCQGHNRCYALAPDVFDVDDLGFAFVKIEGDLPPELEDGARAGAANCPEYAITIDGVTPMTHATRPVTDWATDFDHTDPGWVNDPFPIWDELREKCPVAHSDRYGGVWLPVTPRGRRRRRVRHRALHVAQRDRERRPPERERPARADRHRAADHVRPAVPPVRPAAAAARVRAEADRRARAVHTRRCAASCSTRPPAQTEFDAARRLRAAHPRARDREDARLPAGGRRHLPPVHPPGDRGRRPAARRTAERCRSRTRSTRTSRPGSRSTVEHPQDDLTSFLLDAEIDGQKLEPDHVVGTMVLLMIAGIDTTWSAIGASLWHLGAHPEDRKRLVAEPELLPTAVEEFLRAYAPGHDGAHGRRGLRVRGSACPMQRGRLGAAAVPGRQPRSRAVPRRRRGSSSTGPRTATPRSGSASTAASARTSPAWSSRVALDELLQRYPDFELSDPDAVTWSAGQVRGPRRIPVRIN